MKLPFSLTPCLLSRTDSGTRGHAHADRGTAAADRWVLIDGKLTSDERYHDGLSTTKQTS